MCPWMNGDGHCRTLIKGSSFEGNTRGLSALWPSTMNAKQMIMITRLTRLLVQNSKMESYQSQQSVRILLTVQTDRTGLVTLSLYL